MNENNEIKLTRFNPGAGCGCKISPKELAEILKGSRSGGDFPNLLVGNESNDDAAVYDIGGGRSVISTTDFFTPIVDDPFDYGRIAATNAVSDVYAMGGRPIMAVGILGWPLDKLSSSIASKVVAGARQVCGNAGIPLAGGHSINIADPIFGLAVTGIIDTARVRKNSGARRGDILFLTKPLGIGLVVSAEKFGMVREEDRRAALELMTRLNTPGEPLSEIDGVDAITDVTGFALAGHTIEMAEGSGLKAVIRYDSLPKISGTDYYIEKKCMPGGTFRNFDSYGKKCKMEENMKYLVCDPQTSGGLLIAVRPDAVGRARECVTGTGHDFYEIGRFTEREDGEHYLEII